MAVGFCSCPPAVPTSTPSGWPSPGSRPTLGRIGAGTFDQLIEAIGEICDLFTPDE